MNLSEWSSIAGIVEGFDHRFDRILIVIRIECSYKSHSDNIV